MLVWFLPKNRSAFIKKMDKLPWRYNIQVEEPSEVKFSDIHPPDKYTPLVNIEIYQLLHRWHPVENRVEYCYRQIN